MNKIETFRIDNQRCPMIPNGCGRIFTATFYNSFTIIKESEDVHSPYYTVCLNCGTFVEGRNFSLDVKSTLIRAEKNQHSDSIIDDAIARQKKS